MRQYKSFEVKYCIQCGENVGIETIHQENGETERRCLHGVKCVDTCEFLRGVDWAPILVQSFGVG